MLYHRHNLTEELLAGFYDVSQPTISRTINLIEQALVKILRPLIQPLGKALDAPGSLVIDGTLIPTWNWRSRGK
ncbi:transposase family protein [Rothia terrae]|uniref:Transposase family protein n=1 Tax=Rothia terrae TaxID=396015 RepID=A0A7H2BCR0_9MICC|nr:transposase family protein [Rothia terrae]